MTKLKTYLTDRFPLVPLAIYSLATGLGINSAFNQIDLQKVVITTLLYLSFLLHLRVLDEFKDYAYDNLNHPDRPVQTGLITLGELKIVGILNLVVLFLLAYFASPPQVILLLIIALLYTILMFKEFFAPEFLRSRPLLYLVTHQLVLIPLFLFFYSLFNKHAWTINDLSRSSRLFYTILPATLIEIGRKLKNRYNDKGEKTSDTYAYWWGEKNSLLAFAALVLVAGLLSLYITGFNPLFSFLIIASALIIFAGSFYYQGFLIEKNMLITSFYTLFLLLSLLL